MNSSVQIVAWGAASPLALTARQTGFFLRAGRKSLRLSPFIDLWGERIPIAYNPTLPTAITGPQRMARLAIDALLPAWDRAQKAGARRPCIALALAEAFAANLTPSELRADGEQFHRLLRQSLPLALQDRPIAIFPLGRAGGVAAVDQARAWLQNGEADFVLAGGVDSYYDWSRLEPLLVQDRLLVDDNLDGFYPGEGAAFVALSAAFGSATARIVGTGSAIEPASIESRSPSRAQGATEALRQAVSELRKLGRRCNYWLVDLTHEQYSLKEFQILITRFSGVLGLRSEFQSPLRELGNIGAAAIPMFLALACESWFRHYAPDQFAICLAGSDSGLRGALLLEALV